MRATGEIGMDVRESVGTAVAHARTEDIQVERGRLPRWLRVVGSRLIGGWPGIALLAIVFGGWELIVQTRGIAVIYLPPPSRIVGEIFSDTDLYLNATRVTLSEAALGFVIGWAFALTAAVLMAEFRLMERAFLPLFVLVKTTPSVVLTPVLIIALGFGAGPKVVIAALTLFYATLINAVTGFKSVDENALEVLHSVNASRLEVFFRLRLPNSLPYLFSAAKISVPLALLGAVFAEMQNSREGLGNVIVQAGHNINMVVLWAGIYVVAVLGITLVTLVGAIERQLLRWHSSQAKT
jgi:NitT/TauT family transport system permease protein